MIPCISTFRSVEACVTGADSRLFAATTICPGRPPLCRDVTSFFFLFGERSVVLRGCPTRSSTSLREARRRRRRPRFLAAGSKVPARGHLGLFARYDNLGLFFVVGRALERCTSRTRRPLPHVDVWTFCCCSRGGRGRGRFRFGTSRRLSCRCCCCFTSCPARCDCAHWPCPGSEVG